MDPSLRWGDHERGKSMSIVAIIIAVIAAFLVFRFITGMIKVVVLGVIVLAAIYFFAGGFGG